MMKMGSGRGRIEEGGGGGLEITYKWVHEQIRKYSPEEHLCLV